MARVVVLSFKDNENAETFIDLLDQLQGGDWPGVVGQAIQEMGLILASGSKPEALLARPTMPGCTCKYPQYKTWKPTKRYGWLVCPNCKRPAVQVIRNYIKNLIISGGNNLLAELRERTKNAGSESVAEVPLAPDVQPQGAPTALQEASVEATTTPDSV
jgi:hypothetical protein